MRNWNEKKLKDLLIKRKIRGYQYIHGNSSKKHGRNIKTVTKKSAGLTWLEWNLQYWCNERSIQLVREHQVCKDRKWRFDFAIPSLKIAIEYEGGIFQDNSGHKTAKHYTKDTDKYNRAAEEGWRVIRVTALNYKTVLSTLKSLYEKSRATN